MQPPKNGNLSETPLLEFVLEGFEGGPQTQALLFALFLALYVVAVLGNLTMIVVITLDAHLHSPMYFFLKNLSFLDLCYSSIIAPKALANFLSSSKVITFAGCATQLFFFSLLATSEAFLLAVMAYDRFMAICSPLSYPISMCPSACARLVLGCYCGGCLNSILQASFTFTLPFCSSNHIDHFFCDVPPLLKLACADTTINELNEGNKIPGDMLQTIFEKFYRVDGSRSSGTGGAGLGLAIAKEIVELHGGTIRAKSDNMKTQFIVTLPSKDKGQQKEGENNEIHTRIRHPFRGKSGIWKAPKPTARKRNME